MNRRRVADSTVAPPAERATPVAGGLVAVAGGLLVLGGGLPGVVGAVVLLAAWWFLSPVIVFAVGQVVVTALLAPGAALVPLVGAVLLLGGLLVQPLVRRDRPTATTLAVLASVVGLGSLAAGVWFLSESLWLVAGAVVVVFVVSSFYLHRYTRVRVAEHAGLVPP